MNTVWKYSIDLRSTNGEAEFPMPEGAVFLCVGPEPADPGNAELVCAWFHVQTRRPTEFRRLKVCGTGHPLPDPARYLGSVVNSPFAWHVFELEPSSRTT